MNINENKLKSGTTTVALIAKDCVVLAADTQATLGNINYDEESKKLYKITENIAITNAGIVGDSLVLIRFLIAHAKLYEVERETAIKPSEMASLLSNILNANKMFPYIVQFLIGGFLDKPEIYEVTPYGGIIERKKFAVSGSGTTLALAVLDEQYREAMTKEEAIKLAIKAIIISKKRDIYTGGRTVNVMVIKKGDIFELRQEEIKRIIEEEIKLN